MVARCDLEFVVGLSLKFAFGRAEPTHGAMDRASSLGYMDVPSSEPRSGLA